MPQFLALDGKLLMVAVKTGGRPSEEEMAGLVAKVGIQTNTTYEVRGYSAEEMQETYRTAQRKSSLPDPETMPPLAATQHGILLMVAGVMQSKGLTGGIKLFAAAGDPTLSLYLFEIEEVAATPARFPAAAPPRPAWKFWARPATPHFEDATTVMNGYALSCGPQVIAKFKDRNPWPYAPCAFEIRRPEGASERHAKLSFELSCPDCKKTYALTAELSGSAEGVREVHADCPTCRKHRWMIRTLSYWGKGGHEAWVLNIAGSEKYERAANMAITGIQPKP